MNLKGRVIKAYEYEVIWVFDVYLLMLNDNTLFIAYLKMYGAETMENVF